VKLLDGPILPLSAKTLEKVKKIAVIGPFIDEKRILNDE
jgi:hypothetical protein